ncbi:MAG TPA: hypothetical protein VGQ36_28505 [Thermoanaerobaculia bacterium]|jgi:hypothetical protein|nr:hypothetical protein [Thermoanaerobaculia bacterium]
MIPPRPARWLSVLLLASCANASPLAPGMKAVEEIRGRKFVSEVRNVTIDRADLAAHLKEQMVKSTPYSLDDWGMVLRSLQLVDVQPNEILPKLLSLYESQVLAFYDPHAHTYYAIKQLPKLPPEAAKLVDPKTLEETVMVHELMHALQDQHFSLAAKEKALMRDTDANLAYHAVLEGEAVLVMVAHMLKKSGIEIEEVIKDDAMLGAISSAAAAEQMIDPSTPRYFAEMLKFPYIEGLKFVITAYRRGGWAEVDKVHANPPLTTRELLHPEEYFARTFKPRAFDATKPAGALAVEHLGEFHWRHLVGTDGSLGWVNDRAVIYPDRRVLIETEWESEQRAEAFAREYRSFLENRGLEPKITREGASVRASYTAKK